ncbi:MAG: anti-sigma28 factor (negative regulator of flagellin synthesis) [Granulosicoccus sp.]|jgi:anti-sigma28 factor (negative regulator of flagellin synthesis)
MGIYTMALPESSTTDSNVLKLEDIRDKHKKSTRTAKNSARSRKVNGKHILSAEFETDTRTPGKVAQIEGVPKSDFIEKQMNTEVIKTPAKRSLVSNRRFDKAKVARIKAELAEDSYEIDYLRLADKFIEHERFG